MNQGIVIEGAIYVGKEELQNSRNENRSLTALRLRVPTTANCHVLLEVVFEVEMSHDWFRCVFVAYFDNLSPWNRQFSLCRVSPMHILISHRVQVML